MTDLSAPSLDNLNCTVRHGKAHEHTQYWGFDPGVTGAAACIVPYIDVFTGRVAFEVALIDPPTQARTKDGRREIDPDMMTRAIRNVSLHFIQAAPDCTWRGRAAVEKVGPRPRESVSSTFAFSGSYHVVRGILAGLDFDTELVEPQRWRWSLGLSSIDLAERGVDLKDAVRHWAAETFPDAAGDLKRKKDSGRADALAIAFWRYKQHAGN